MARRWFKTSQEKDPSPTPPEVEIVEPGGSGAKLEGVPGGNPPAPGERWMVTPEMTKRGVQGWVLALRGEWPREPSPVVTNKERAMIKDMISMYGPDVWGKMCSVACSCWLAIRDQYRINDRRPTIQWIYWKRQDVASATATGGFASRSNRDWKGEVIVEGEKKHGW